MALLRFGDPWHGIWNAAGLALPNGQTKTIARYPLGGEAAYPDWFISDAQRGSIHPAAGDCFLVKIPGQSEVTTSASDANKGMTWLNYALMCGARHLFYGVELGGDRWIYIDPQNKPWVARIRRGLPRPNGTWTPFFEFKKGLIFDSAAQPTVVSCYPDFPDVWVSNSLLSECFLLDASSDGRFVNCGVWMRSGSSSQLGHLMQVLFSGTPGIDLSCALLSNLDQFEDTRGYSPDYYVIRTAGRVMKMIEPMGSIFDGVSRSSVLIGHDLTYSDQHRSGSGQQHVDTVTGNLKIQAGQSVVNIPISIQTIVPASSSDPIVSTTSFAGYEISNFFVPELTIVRRTNKILEVGFDATQVPISPGMLHSICLVHPDRVANTGSVVNIADTGRFFCYHPVTKQLLQSSGQVCFM